MNNILKVIDTLRVLSVEQSTNASSGHPGIALGAAPMINTLYNNVMNIPLSNKKWINRDRFILAAGHGSSLLYSVLHVAGYNVTIDDLKKFRQYGSITPGHPEVDMTEGVDATSGPLGQGISEAVGMAIAERYLAARYNKDNLNLMDHYTYVICGDGDLQEGVTQEAMSLAGHLALNKLVVLYDSNDIQLDGPLNNANSENVKKKYEAMNWNYLFLNDGEDYKGIDSLVKKAQSSDKPTIIEIKTIIGRGTALAGTSASHGSPLSKEEVDKLRFSLGGEAFQVDEEVYQYYKDNFVKRSEAHYEKWLSVKEQYQKEYPNEYSEFEKLINNEFVVDFENLIKFDEDFNKATRVSSGKIIDALGKVHPGFLGGSADLTSSTKAKGADGNFTKITPLGRNINFGVREHAMAAITNGISLHGGLTPFCSGFFVFSDYMKPAMRLAAIMDLPIIYVFTHDSIAVGEDGPTHQPVEQVTMLRSIPNFTVIRPADANETKAAWEIALNSKTTPTALLLTRQDVPMLTTASEASKVKFGGYIKALEKEKLDGIIIASGSEVSLALEAKEELYSLGIDVRVVSMPSINLFEKQSSLYQESILPKSILTKVAIEMSDATHYYKYVGTSGSLINIQRFGMSSPYQTLVSNYGFNLENIVSEFLITYNKNK